MYGGVRGAKPVTVSLYSNLDVKPEQGYISVLHDIFFTL